MQIARFKATWLENLILNNLLLGGEVQIMTFSRSKLGPKLKGREWPPWKSSWATFFFSRQVFFFLLGAFDPLYPGQMRCLQLPLFMHYWESRIRQRPKTPILFENHSTLKHGSHSFILHFFIYFFILLLLFIYFGWFFWISFDFFPFFEFFFLIFWISFFLDCVCPN